VPGPNVADRNPAYPIGSVGNALQILLMLRESPSVRVADVARDLGIARSTAHRLLVLLQQFDFVAQEEGSRAYTRGPSLVQVGVAAVNNLPVRQAAFRAIRMLRDSTGETAELCVLDGHESVVVDIAEGALPLRVVDEYGERMSAHLTAAGKAMLATIPVDDLRLRFPREELDVVTDTSIGTMTQLQQELEVIREVGYATNLGEGGPEFVGIAAAIVSPIGETLGAVTVALPWERAGEGFQSHLGPQVKRSAEAIGRRL
jgi:DNA-binding IclR family transcriptional regulator